MLMRIEMDLNMTLLIDLIVLNAESKYIITNGSLMLKADFSDQCTILLAARIISPNLLALSLLHSALISKSI
jgi:hypothetical protein